MTQQPNPSTTSEIDMNMNINQDDQAHSSEPPARLAARFHHKSSARRRSSAHSSRRSSLSSMHSRNSTLSCHGGPYSTHIAQHLRRASIIESRKARLAERAAHAEQVRLRAAAAKSIQRTSNIEEKALAAQAAREKLLAEIAARCEEEVRRAKRIAEETKEKKAAEHARLRDEMAEKFADAARRKSIYQSAARRPRTTSLAAVEEKKIDPVQLKKLSQTAAARVIQRIWRTSHTRRVATAFLALNVDITHLKTMPFEDVTRLISEEPTIFATIRLLKEWNMLDSSNDETANRGAVRVFLSAFMIVSHPIQAFSHGGKEEQERDLVIKGSALVEAVNVKAHAMAMGTASTTNQEQLQFLFNDFTSAFHAWKSQDLGVLIDVMVGSFVNLDLILQSTKDDRDGHVADDYLQAVRQEQVKILARLKRLAGPDQALSRIRVAVRKARKERAAQQALQSSDHIPRATTPTDMEIDISPTVLLTPPATPTHESSQPGERAASFVTRLGETMTVLPSNREIAHEMQINGSFEIQQEPWTDVRKDFMEALRRGMRESMRSGGRQAEASWTHSMAVLIKEKIMNLISARHPLYERIDGFLDPRLIDQQCRNGAFSYSEFFDTIANLIGQICSPGRDEAVKEFANNKTSDTIDRLFSLINILDLMTLDHINFQFRMATRSVVEHGHEHEHAMFERALQDNVHDLSRTRQWWASAKLNTNPSQATSATYGSVVYARGLTDLVLSNNPLKFEGLPETLRLDYMRLLKIRARIFHMVAVSSILLTSKIRMRRNRESLWVREAERLMKLDLAGTDVSRIVSIIESSHMMPDSTKNGLIDFVSRVLPSAVASHGKWKATERARQKCLSERRTFDPLMSEANQQSDDYFIEQIATFILKSLREHVFSRLSATSTAEKVRVTTGASETLARIGMPEFVAEVGSIIDVLERVRNVDLKAHEKWYDEVAGQIGRSSAV